MAIQNLTFQQVRKLLQQHSLPGEVSGKGKDWEIEVPDEKGKRKLERVLKGLGGFRTGYGSWILRPNYQSQGDWNDPSSRHHYADKTAGRLDGARGHMLMPSAVKSKLPRMRAQEDVEDPIVYAKFFSPYSGAVWLVTEYDGRDEMFGWADLGFGMGELGYISLNELDTANRRGLPLVERDMSFKPMPLSKAKRQSKNAARNPFLQSLDPDQERLAEELHLMAENDGSAYQKRDAEGAVTKAQRELRQSKTRDLDFDLKKVGPAVVKSLKARWAQSERDHRQNQRSASMNKQAIVQEAMKRAKTDPEFRKKLVAAVQKKAQPGGPVSKDMRKHVK